MVINWEVTRCGTRWNHVEPDIYRTRILLGTWKGHRTGRNQLWNNGRTIILYFEENWKDPGNDLFRIWESSHDDGTFRELRKDIGRI